MELIVLGLCVFVYCALLASTQPREPGSAEMMMGAVRGAYMASEQYEAARRQHRFRYEYERQQFIASQATRPDDHVSR